MSYETILVGPEGAVTLVTLNRPERLNALNRTMIAELHSVLDDAARDGRTRALVLTGAGCAFCAGADLSDPGGPGGLLPEASPESKRQGLRHGIHPLIPRSTARIFPSSLWSTVTPPAAAATWRSRATCTSPPSTRASWSRSRASGSFPARAAAGSRHVRSGWRRRAR
jgi:hypothetical protein